MTISYLFPRMDSFSRTNQGWVSRASLVLTRLVTVLFGLSKLSSLEV